MIFLISIFFLKCVISIPLVYPGNTIFPGFDDFGLMKHFKPFKDFVHPNISLNNGELMYTGQNVVQQGSVLLAMYPILVKMDDTKQTKVRNLVEQIFRIRMHSNIYPTLTNALDILSLNDEEKQRSIKSLLDRPLMDVYQRRKQVSRDVRNLVDNDIRKFYKYAFQNKLFPYMGLIPKNDDYNCIAVKSGTPQMFPFDHILPWMIIAAKNINPGERLIRMNPNNNLAFNAQWDSGNAILTALRHDQMFAELQRHLNSNSHEPNIKDQESILGCFDYLFDVYGSLFKGKWNTIEPDYMFYMNMIFNQDKNRSHYIFSDSNDIDNKLAKRLNYIFNGNNDEIKIKKFIVQWIPEWENIKIFGNVNFKERVIVDDVNDGYYNDVAINAYDMLIDLGSTFFQRTQFKTGILLYIFASRSGSNIHWMKVLVGLWKEKNYESIRRVGSVLNERGLNLMDYIDISREVLIIDGSTGDIDSENVMLGLLITWYTTATGTEISERIYGICDELLKAKRYYKLACTLSKELYKTNPNHRLTLNWVISALSFKTVVHGAEILSIFTQIMWDNGKESIHSLNDLFYPTMIAYKSRLSKICKDYGAKNVNDDKIIDGAKAYFAGIMLDSHIPLADMMVEGFKSGINDPYKLLIQFATLYRMMWSYQNCYDIYEPLINKIDNQHLTASVVLDYSHCAIKTGHHHEIMLLKHKIDNDTLIDEVELLADNKYNTYGDASYYVLCLYLRHGIFGLNKDFICIDQSNYKILYDIGFEYIKRKKFEKAIKYLELSIKQNATEAHTHLAYLDALFQLERYDEIISFYEDTCTDIEYDTQPQIFVLSVVSEIYKLKGEQQKCDELEAKLAALNPTNNPTNAPTIAPSISPIKTPTMDPTFSPIKEPTNNPTYFFMTDNPRIFNSVVKIFNVNINDRIFKIPSNTIVPFQRQIYSILNSNNSLHDFISILDSIAFPDNNDSDDVMNSMRMELFLEFIINLSKINQEISFIFFEYLNSL